MAISETTRKQLWGLSGSRCAICKERLVLDLGEGGTLVGEEAHIEGRGKNGPRHNSSPTMDVDGFDNLILLCPRDHTAIDKEPDLFPVEKLRRIKREHESEVGEALAQRFGDGSIQRLFDAAKMTSFFNGVPPYPLGPRSALFGSQASIDLETLFAMRAADFENLIADLLERDGYEVSMLAEHPGTDFGYDIIASVPLPGGDRQFLVIECKKYQSNNPVGVQAVRKLGAAASKFHQCQGLLISTSGFTKLAVEEANERNVSLVDGQALVRWLAISRRVA